MSENNKKEKKERKGELTAGFYRWSDDIVSELKSITWPSKSVIGQRLISVVVISCIAGTILYVADLLLELLASVVF